MTYDVMYVVGGAVVGAVVGSVVTRAWLEKKYIDATMELFDEMKLTDDQYNTVMGYADDNSSREQAVIHIKVEEVSGVRYVYNKKTNQFIVQGTTAEELKELLIKKIPAGTYVSCLVEDGRQLIE